MGECTRRTYWLVHSPKRDQIRANGWQVIGPLSLATAAAPTTGDNNVGECWGGRARSLSLRGMGVVGVSDNDGSVWACRNRRAGDALHAHRGVDAVCSQLR